MVPLPPRCPASRRRPPGTPTRPIAVILYHLLLGQARCASAHVTPASPHAWIPAPARIGARGVNLADPRRWPRCVAAPPRVQRCSRGLQAVPANPGGNDPHVCTQAQGGTSPKTPGAPRPHKSRTEAAPCVAERLRVQRRVYTGARDAPWCTGPLQPARHRRGAVKAPSPGLLSVLCGSCHGAKRRTSRRLLRRPPPVLCDAGARATAHRGSRHADRARGARVGTAGTGRREAAPQYAALPCRPQCMQQAGCAKSRPQARVRGFSCSALAAEWSWPLYLCAVP
jgi:hypothetical protein